MARPDAAWGTDPWAEKEAPAWDLAEVRRIVRDKLRGQKVDIYLFGSRARGDARRFSDIDVGILPLEPLPAGLLAEIRDALRDSQVIFEVDLVDLSEAPEPMRRRALKEGVTWSG